MDKQKAEKLNAIGMEDSSFKIGEKTVQFSRTTNEDVARIEKLSDDDLVKEYLELHDTIFKDECFGISDMQLLFLYELELDERKLWHRIDAPKLNVEDK